MAKETFVGVIKPGCQPQCGNIKVPYPFGIANGSDTSCSLDYKFALTCENTTVRYTFDNVPSYAPRLKLGYEYIYNISDSELRLKSWVSLRCYNKNGTAGYGFQSAWTNLRNFDQFLTLSEKNKLTVVGCDDYSLIKGRSLKAQTMDYDFSSGCISSCLNISDVANDRKCLGNGCCQISIAHGLQSYNAELNSFRNHTDVWSFNNCSMAFLGEEGTFEFRGARDLRELSEVGRRVWKHVPVVIDWVIATNKSCSSLEAATVCKNHSHCYDVQDGGYRCRCNKGYEGNPYLENDSGCQDIDECKDRKRYPCHGTCNNTLGSYNCTCPSGFYGNAKSSSGCLHQSSEKQTPLAFILGIEVALPVTVIALLLGLFYVAHKRKLAKLREKYYEQNGGALLKDKLRARGGADVSSVNIFCVEELKKATNNFAEGNIIGKGGNGTVYKGTLKDERFVAIKKSQRVNEGQREEFINEMVILTQINHTNIVQLIGFCLETEVPLLAYEFVSNGTLHHHIHNVKTGTKRLSWDTRLRIAQESAGALAYLHTDARMSIIHRDVKSTNILLDENYTAKIADFGASRLVPLGHDEVTTLVQGTLGYLDPEYFHTGHLTDKSDVYSFGVVLAELLTGKQPLSMERCPEERNLATYFVKVVVENNFLDILEQGVVKEAAYEQLKAIADLVCRCLNQVGGNRPSMKEVTMELDTLTKLGKPTNWDSQDNYNETSSHMSEMEPTDPDTVPPMPTSDSIEMEPTDPDTVPPMPTSDSIEDMQFYH